MYAIEEMLIRQAELQKEANETSWKKISKEAVYIEDIPFLVKSPFKTTKPENTTRFVCVADTHELHSVLLEKLPPGDVFIHCGDFSLRGEPLGIESFIDFVKADLPKFGFQHKIVIAGNHDIPLDKNGVYTNAVSSTSHIARCPSEAICDHLLDLVKKNTTYLLDEATEVNGIKIYGSPYTWLGSSVYNLGFNVKRGPDLIAEWAKIPADADIVMTHEAPLGRGDFTHAHIGDLELLEAVQKIKPLLHIFGHIHRGYGVSYDGNTVFANVTACDSKFNQVFYPIVFDIPNGGKTKK